MRPFLAAFIAEWRVLIAYRSAAIAGILTQIAFGLVNIQVLSACYRHGPAQIFTLAAATDYVWLMQSFFRLIPQRPDPRVVQGVRSGNIAGDLLRPVDAYYWWLARAIAGYAAPTLLRCLPLLVLALLVGWLRPPANTEAALAFAVAITLACLLAATFSVLMALTAFWTLAGDGIGALMPPLVWLMSGVVLPLPLWPDSLRWLVDILPFRAVLDTPARIWSGELAGANAVAAIAHQCAWIAAFLLIGRWLAARGLRRLIIQGG